MYISGGGTPQSVLRAATAVKILTEKFYNGYFAIVRFIAEISLDRDQLDPVYQRDIVA